MKLLLPPRPSLPLEPGLYLLPDHFTLADTEGTVQIVRELLPGLHGVEPISLAQVTTGSGKARAAKDTLAFLDARWPGAEHYREALVSRLRKLEYRAVFARIPGTSPEESRWLERTLKPATVSALREAVHLSALPDTERATRNAELVRAASALSNEPFELRLLVEEALEKIAASPAETGDSRESLQRALELVAGGRLLERLRALAGEDLRAAVTLLMSGGEGDPYDAGFRLGAEALQRLGLATYRHGDVALGPLARAVASHQAIRDTLVQWLPPEAWSSRTIELVDAAHGWGKSANTVSWGELGVGQLAPVDALILTVLGEEHDAVMAEAGAPDQNTERLDVGPGAKLELVTLAGQRPLRLAIAQMRELGGIVSRGAVKDLIYSTRAPLVATCGVCAGIPGEVEIGDVIVADTVLRSEAQPNDGERYVRWDRDFRLRDDWQREARAFSGRVFPGRVHFGALATGILRAPKAVEQLRLAHQRVLGIEMEAQTLHTIASEDAIVVRGVSDFADGPKHENAQVAARAAAAWLLGFLRERSSSPTRATE